MSPVNPGERWPRPTTTQQVAAFARTNSIVVAFMVGEIAGLVTMGLALLITGGR